MLIAKNPDRLQKMLISRILDNSARFKSRYGSELRSKPILAISEKIDVDSEYSHFWYACGESYEQRIGDLIDKAVRKLMLVPYTRRVSLPIWKPKDHLCRTPPAITEISLLLHDDKLHATAFIRSLDALNYFKANFSFVSHVLDEISEKAGFDAGSVALLIAAPHIYERDVERIQKTKYEEVFGYHKLGTHVIEDYLSSAWHSALECIYNCGSKKKTEWGEFFEGQEESKYIHRLFIEVKNTVEHQIHDKAPFTKKYGMDYAHDYVIHAANIDKPVSESILKAGESYSYAERARYCEKDDVRVDQLYTVIKKLREDISRRDCYIGISRQWDIESDEPPCLRGYQFVMNEKFSGIFYMRSNDAYGAMHANMFAFNLLTSYVAEMLDIKEHAYYHFALDAHIYSEFIDAVKEILSPKMPTFLEKAKNINNTKGDLIL